MANDLQQKQTAPTYAYSQVRVLFAGGGSGGHIYPLLAVAQSLRRIAKEHNIQLALNYLGPSSVIAETLKTAGVRVGTIFSGKLRRQYGLIKNLFDAPKFIVGILVALGKLFFIMPDVIFSKGGPGALPVVLAGWFYRIPIIIHESDVAPGLTNKISGRIASRIAVSFAKSLEYFDPAKTAFIGTPIREELLGDIPAKAEAKQSLGFDPAKPLILVIGGSQGSQRINEFILTHIADIARETQILHQAGPENFAKFEPLARAALREISLANPNMPPYRVVGYFDGNYKHALAAADLVISRAGSGSISEIAAFGKPSILIPLKEAANDHQRLNAYEFAKTGATLVIEESNLLIGIFLGQLKVLFENEDKLEAMREAAHKLFKPGAADTIADEILRFAQ